jgi:hypothetical protein
MLVKILGFGINWWARFGSDLQNPGRFTRCAAFYNSTGVRCGGKIQRHWVVPGLIRFNGVGDFNPHLPSRSIGDVFSCSALTPAFGGNRMLFESRSAHATCPDCYLVVLSSDLNGRIDFGLEGWKAREANVIAASELRQMQETMLLMTPGSWVRTDCGYWQLRADGMTSPLCGLELVGDRIPA